MKKLLGIDIGGTKCAVIDGRYSGGELNTAGREVFETKEYRTPGAALNQIAVLAEKLTGGDILSYAGVGISCGGPLNSRTGCIMSPPNLPDWDCVDVVSFFEDRFGIPVFLQNDANAGALAEWKFGAGRGLDDIIFLTCGTGLGAGLILNGSLYSGKNDMAGEAGHIRLAAFGPVGYGKCGSFEGFCSGSGIAHLAALKVMEYRQRGLAHPLMDREITSKEVFALAKEGDRLCKEICDTAGEYMGRGMAVLIDILNPQAIIGGSVFARNYELLLPAVSRVIEKECIPAAAEHCRILPAMLSESIGDMAALTVALGCP